VNVPDRLADAEGALPPITDVVPVASLVSVALMNASDREARIESKTVENRLP